MERPEIGDLVNQGEGCTEYVVSDIRGLGSAAPVWEMRLKWGGGLTVHPVPLSEIDTWRVEAKRGTWVPYY